MAGVKIRLDRDGIAEMLRSAPVEAAVLAKAEMVQRLTAAARTVAKRDAPVWVGAHETDRAAATVTIAHAGGMAMEAKHGPLTKAARAVGLDIAGTTPEELKRAARRRKTRARKRREAAMSSDERAALEAKRAKRRAAARKRRERRQSKPDEE
jgi:hypothetical protein